MVAADGRDIVQIKLRPEPVLVAKRAEPDSAEMPAPVRMKMFETMDSPSRREKMSPYIRTR